MGGKKKSKKLAPVAVATDDAADNALLDALIAANLQAAAARDDESLMARIDLIAPGQFAREEFPGLKSSCAMCGRAAAALPCAQCKLRLYCGKECQQAAWKLCHKTTCGGPWPTPPTLARAGSAAVVDWLHEFGCSCASLTDLCLLRLSMSITKEGRRHRLVMPDAETLPSITARLRELCGDGGGSSGGSGGGSGGGGGSSGRSGGGGVEAVPIFLRALFGAMQAWVLDPWVQNSALALLTTVVGVAGRHADPGQEVAAGALARAGALVHIAAAMRAHPTDARIQAGGACVVSALCQGRAGAQRRQLALAARLLPLLLRTLSVTRRVAASGELPYSEGIDAAEVRASDAQMRTEADGFMRTEACSALTHLAESGACRAAAVAAGAFQVLCALLAARQGRETELQRHVCGLITQLCHADADGDGDGDGDGETGAGAEAGAEAKTGAGAEAEARCSAAETAGLIAAVCALRNSVGPVRKAATCALRAICCSDESRWREAKAAGAPAAWRKVGQTC